MWEFLTFAAGMVVWMLVCAFLPHVFDLPEAIAKYLGRRSRRSGAGLPLHDPDQEATCLLGESLRRAQLSAEATAQVMAAFWAADVPNRRALAHLVAGMTGEGPVEDEDLLVLLPDTRAASECPAHRDKKPPISTDIRELPVGLQRH
jgi:hypothetical protein